MSAVVYRGRPICLFDLYGSAFLGTCSKERRADEEFQEMDEEKVTPVIAIIFNPRPDVSLLAATYIDGDLALFDPCELSLIAVVEADAQVLACSPDGRTLATGDSIGNIQLFEFETLRLMYRIRADEYQIKGLAFSDDGLRFCDVRGPQCNVWEPSVLVRTQFDEKDSLSNSTPPRSKTVDIVDQEDVSEITTIVCHPTEQSVFCGNDNGEVLAFDTATARQTQALWNHTKSVPVLAFVWAPTSNLLISADAASRIKAYKLDFKSQRWETTGPLLDTRLDYSINHLAINAQNDTVIVSSINPINQSQHSQKQAEQTSSLNLDTFSTTSLHTGSSKGVVKTSEPDMDPLPEFIQHVMGKIGTSLIFLDKSLWICSVAVKGSREGYSRHFFLPDDWLNASQVFLSRVTPQGDCVFAQKDAFVVIKQGLRYEEHVSAGLKRE